MSNLLIPSSTLNPGVFLQYFAAQGQSISPAGPRAALYCSPMTSSGTGVSGTVYGVKSEDQIIDLAGNGSPAHRNYRMHAKENKSGKVNFLLYTMTSGTSADGYSLFSGTATAQGYATITICGEDSTVAVNSGDTADAVAGKLVSTINSKTWLPVVATKAATGKVLTTAKVKGKAQGDGTIGVIRFRTVVKSGIGITVVTSGSALGLGSGTPGADGGTTEAQLLATALSGIESQAFYYVAINSFDAASLAAQYNHLVLKNSPQVGLFSVGVAGFTGPISSAAPLAVTLNYEVMQLVNQPNSEHDVAELVAWVVATRQREEQLSSKANLTGKRSANLKAVFANSDFPDFEDIGDALTDGVAPIGSDANGGYLVKSVTTRSKDPSGAVDDQRAADTHRVSIGHEFMETLRNRFINTFGGFNIKDDEKNLDGTVNLLAKVPTKTVTPNSATPFFKSLIKEFADDGKLKNLAQMLEALRVDIDASNHSRLEAEIALDTVDILTQLSAKVNEVSSG